MRSPFYVHLEVDDRPGVLADVARRLAAHDVSVARGVPAESGAVRIVVHEAPQRALDDALAEIVQLPQVHARPSVLPVVSDRGVAGSAGRDQNAFGCAGSVRKACSP